MLGYAALIIEIAGYSLLAWHLLGIRLHVAPALFVSAAILVLYASDFLGQLQLASQLVHWIGLASLPIFLAYVLLKSGSSSQLPITVFFAVPTFLVWLWFLNVGAEFHSWDEFSHWGSVVRSLYEANTFRLSPNPLYFQDYPPGLALFAYHSLQSLGYSEGNVYLSYAIVIASFALALTGPAMRLGSIPFLIVFAVVCACIQQFGHGFSSVLVDHLLSILFAGAIAIYFEQRDVERGLWAVPVVLGALALAKNAGTFFSVLAAFICIVDTVIVRRQSTISSKDDLRHAPVPRVADHVTALLRKLSLSSHDAVFAAAIVSIPFAISLTWSYYVQRTGLNVGWSDHSPTAGLTNLLICCQSSREIEVAGKFFSSMFGVTPPNPAPASLLGIGLDAFKRGLTQWSIAAPGFAFLELALIGLALGVLSLQLTGDARGLALTGFLGAGCAGYSLSLLTAYLYAFSDFEARALISFARFENVYVLTWTLLTLYLFTRALGELPRAIIFLGAALIAIWSHYRLYSVEAALESFARRAAKEITKLIHMGSPEKLPKRDDVRKWALQLSHVIPTNAKVYIAWPQSHGLEFWLAKHELLPRVTNRKCFSFSTTGTPEIVEDCRMSETDLSATLRGYDYLVVGSKAEFLRSQYPTLLADIPSNAATALLKIRTPAKAVQLEPLSLESEICATGKELKKPFGEGGGFSFTARVSSDLGPDDTSPAGSRTMLCENGKFIGSPGALHAAVRTKGGGLYSHLPTYVLMSSSDNSNPNVNGRVYRIVRVPPER